MSYPGRAYDWMCVLVKDLGRQLPLELACTRVNRVVLINLCAETTKPIVCIVTRGVFIVTRGTIREVNIFLSILLV